MKLIFLSPSNIFHGKELAHSVSEAQVNRYWKIALQGKFKLALKSAWKCLLVQAFFLKNALFFNFPAKYRGLDLQYQSSLLSKAFPLWEASIL